MKTLVTILIAGALVNPVFAELPSANSSEIGGNAPAFADAQDTLTVQPAASSASVQTNGTDNSNKTMKKQKKKQQPEEDFYKSSYPNSSGA